MMRGGQLRAEVWNVDGTGYAVATVAIPSGELTATYPQTLSNGDAVVNVAFYRQCTGIIAAGSAPPQDAPTGSVCPSGTVMISWDPTGHTGSGGSIAIPDTSGNSITLSVPNATFVTTPVYNPGCVPGTAQSVALGNTLTLNGSGSIPLNNNNVLTCHWDAIASSEPGQLPNQTGLTWPSGQNICNPPVSGFLQGPANFQLTVKDSALNTSVCTVHDGAIQVDGAGMVVPQTDSTGSLAKIYKLVGPLKQWGNNPTWPAVDAFHMTWANTLGPQQGFTIPGQVGPGVWQDKWNTALDTGSGGTVAMTNGTNTVVGTNTHFTTTMCQGPGSPTVPQTSMYFILWPTYPITGGGGGTSRSYNPVDSCTDDTHLTVHYNWANPTQSGMQYSADDQFTQASWMNTGGVDNINFYDNVLMYVSLWLRTGIDSYLHYARWLAQRFWTYPLLDRGNANGCAWVPANCSNTPIVPRNASLQGVVVEALYQDYVAGTAGASGIWAGLEELEPSWEFGMTSSLIGDLRESSYNDMQPALLAAYDPNTGPAASARSFLHTTLNGFWTGQKTADNHWQAAAYGYLSAPAKWTNGANTNVRWDHHWQTQVQVQRDVQAAKDCINASRATHGRTTTPAPAAIPSTPGAQTVSITTQSSLGYLNGRLASGSCRQLRRQLPICLRRSPPTSGTTLAFTVTANTVNTPCSGFGGTGAHTDWQISSSTSAGQLSFQFPATFTSFLWVSNNGTTRDQNVYQAVLVDSTHALLTSPYIDNCSAGGNSCSGRDWMICTGRS